MTDLKRNEDIKKVEDLDRKIYLQGEELIAYTDSLPKLQYAFYLSSKNKIIQKKTYSSNQQCKFKVPDNINDLSVTFFYIDINSNKVKFSVNYEFENNSDRSLPNSYEFIKSDDDFFLDFINNRLNASIDQLIFSLSIRFKDLENRAKSRKYMRLIELAKKNSYKDSNLLIISSLAVQIYEDRYTLVAYAGLCAEYGSIIESYKAMQKLSRNYNVEESLLNKIELKLIKKLNRQVLDYPDFKKLFKNAIGRTLSYQESDLYNDLLTELIENGADKVIDRLVSDTGMSNKNKARYALKLAKAAKQYQISRPSQFEHDTLLLADYALNRDRNEGTLRNVYFAYQRINNYKGAKKVLTLLSTIAGDNPTPEQRKLLWSTPEHLITLADQVPEYRQTPAYQPIKGKVCYVIHNSLPYSSGGYATRGHGLVTAIRQHGIDIYAITRPGYPHDISPIKVEEVNLEDYIDGVVYKRLLSPSRRDYSNYEYMLKAVESYKQSFMRDKPALIIAASNHLDGLPAMFAARSLGIPFIYEIRGFWEVTRLSKYPEFEHDPMFEVEKRLEAVVAEHANHIFTLTQGMVDELETRGVDTEERITLLPNSCDVERFHPTSLKDEALAAQWNIPLNIPVIGYIGTLVSYEGLDDLATACAELKQMDYEFRLLIVGNENATGQGKGSIVSQIQNIATEGDFGEWLIMPGRVPFEEVERYYSLIDIAPFPRKAWPVCEIVPPMKTLEALSMQKPVIVSSNKALTEMITHNENGLIFERGDTDDLINQLKYLLDHPEKWEAYGKAGRQFVENERTWVRTAQKATKVLNNFI